MHRVDDAELAESRIHVVREPITGDAVAVFARS